PVFVTPEPRTLGEAGGGTHETRILEEATGEKEETTGVHEETTGIHETSGVHETHGVFATLAAGIDLGVEDPLRLKDARVCYVCKKPRDRVHFFYDQLCGACGDFNYAKRSQTANLTGRTAVISGARVKIGYQAAIMLLRAGARVIVTTRFPR